MEKYLLEKTPGKGLGCLYLLGDGKVEDQQERKIICAHRKILAGENSRQGLGLFIFLG